VATHAALKWGSGAAGAETEGKLTAVFAYVSSLMIPFEIANLTSAVREWMSSFSEMFVWWAMTVLALMFSRPAISL
jgi:hypothetical protein